MSHFPSSQLLFVDERASKKHNSLFNKVLLGGQMFPRAASEDGKGYFHLFSSVDVGWHKVLQYGRAGRSSFTNNEASRPSHVDAVHSLNRTDSHRTQVFCTVCVCKHTDKHYMFLSVNVFPFL